MLDDERLKQGKRLGKAYFNRLPEALAAYTKNKNFHLGKSKNCPNNQDYLTAECELPGSKRMFWKAADLKYQA